MKYVHYWHFYKRWYAEINDDPNPERVFWHNSISAQEYWDRVYLIENTEWTTHREVKAKLQELYPECILIKDRPFHQGARWHGYKHGSRRYDNAL